MKNPSNDFAKVNGAQKAALDGLQTYAEKIRQDQELALLKLDLAWEVEKRRFEPKPEHHLHYGKAAPQLSQFEYSQLRTEHFERRKEVTDRFDEKTKDVHRVKELVLDRFNENARNRQTPEPTKTLQRSMRGRATGRER